MHTALKEVNEKQRQWFFISIFLSFPLDASGGNQRKMPRVKKVNVFWF
jgi:hypothetical protein